ncbi:MAG: thiamine-phosphate kinase [Deltaproteobacteria bacterium]|nr:thiamine-phosphate kinase [Deltaproteobacteria bacterium]
MNLSEFDLIRKIQSHVTVPNPQVICGIGDDCAVVDKGGGIYLLMTTDCVVEKIHFEPKYFTAFETGKKAFAASLSDIAAMGGTPKYAMTTLGIPQTISEKWIDELTAGFQQEAQSFNVSIVGGDISRSPKSFFADIVQVGEVGARYCKFRKGAKEGDGIFVSGPLGSSALGLYLLKKGKSGESPYVRAHKTPRARIGAGQFLGKEAGVTAMIDISDGLLQDLGHVLEQSEVGAAIRFVDVPRERDFEMLVREQRLSAHDLILGGGEDYQLLFTVHPSAKADFKQRVQKAGFKFYEIGTITNADEGLKVLDERGMELKKVKKGFDHFR